jgi:hypothetical protein
MRAFLVLCLFISVAVAQTIYDDLPGADDTSKVDNLRRAVAQFRQYAAGQACFTEFFTELSNANTINRWAAWLCTYFGGPTDFAGCGYYLDDNDNTTLITNVTDLKLDLSVKHSALPLGTAHVEAFVPIMARALTRTDTAPATLEGDIVDALSDLGADVVFPGNEALVCRTPSLTLSWRVGAPGFPYSNNSPVNRLVTWSWDDDLPHTVTPNAGETVPLIGFGSGPTALTRNTTCITTSAQYPGGGTPCNLGTIGTFSYSHFFLANDTIGYHCNTHAALTGTLIVGNGGGQNTGTNTETAPADVDVFDTSDGADGGGDSAVRICSWL